MSAVDFDRFYLQSSIADRHDHYQVHVPKRPELRTVRVVSLRIACGDHCDESILLFFVVWGISKEKV